MVAKTEHSVTRIPVRVLLGGTDAAASAGVVEQIVEGWLVAPGLAVCTTIIDGRMIRGSYSLIHLPSGRSLADDLCAGHVDQAVRAAIATGIDWTDEPDQVLADPRIAAMRPGSTPWDRCGRLDMSCRIELYPPAGTQES